MCYSTVRWKLTAVVSFSDISIQIIHVKGHRESSWGEAHTSVTKDSFVNPYMKDLAKDDWLK